jgi:hypothetical protein
MVAKTKSSIYMAWQVLNVPAKLDRAVWQERPLFGGKMRRRKVILCLKRRRIKETR